MVDPVSGAGKGVSEIAKKQMEGSSGASGVGEAQKGDSPSFDEVMKQGADEAQGVEGAGQVDQVQEAEKVQKQEFDKVDGVESGTSKVEGREVKLEEFLNEMSGDRQELDDMMERVMGGENMDQKELLEMQSLIYQYSQKVELTSKVVEKGTGGLKQMLNMQV